MQDSLKQEIRSSIRDSTDRIANKLIEAYDSIIDNCGYLDNQLVQRIIEYIIKDIVASITNDCKEIEKEIVNKMTDSNYIKNLIDTVTKENAHE